VVSAYCVTLVQQGVSGSGLVYTINFNAASAGSAQLDLDQVTIAFPDLTDRAATHNDETITIS
jgi:hypothetical protein